MHTSIILLALTAMMMVYCAQDVNAFNRHQRAVDPLTTQASNGNVTQEESTTPTPTSPTTTPTPATKAPPQLTLSTYWIVLGVIFAVIFITLIIVGVVCWGRRRH